MRFSLFTRNYILTSSALSVTSGTGTVSNVIDRKPSTKWVTSGQNSDAATATLRVVFPSATNISYIMLQNHNFASFRILYNSGTTFSPNLSVTGNTASNTFFGFSSVTVNSFDIHVTATHSTNAEKYLGEVIASNLKVTLDTNPMSVNYRPVRYKKGVEYELSDGGIVSVFLAQKFRADITLHNILTATAESLTAIYDEHKNLIFVPFGVSTFTSYWYGEAYHVNWIGDLDIFQHRDDVISNGYQGSIRLAQIPD